MNAAGAPGSDEAHRHGVARDRFARARVARLATVDADGGPHLVPIVFVVVEDTVWSAIDSKPKSTRALRRLDNIRVNPWVSLLVDHYSDDWTACGGSGWTATPGSSSHEPAPVRRSRPCPEVPSVPADAPAGPLLGVTANRWASWSHTPTA